MSDADDEPMVDELLLQDVVDVIHCTDCENDGIAMIPVGGALVIDKTEGERSLSLDEIGEARCGYCNSPNLHYEITIDDDA